MAAASQITKRIDIIVFVRRALQLFTALEVNKSKVLCCCLVVEMRNFHYKNVLKTVLVVFLN